MLTIRLEKDGDVVWLEIDNCQYEISRDAYSQLCIGMNRFDKSNATMKEIRLDVADDDFEDYEGADDE